MDGEQLNPIHFISKLTTRLSIVWSIDCPTINIVILIHNLSMLFILKSNFLFNVVF